MNLKIIKISSIIFIPILLLVLGTDFAIYSLTMDKHRAMTAVTGYRHVEKAKNQIARNLDTVLKDLTMIAFIHESYDIYDGRITQDLEDTFMTVSYNRRLYDHIRYLDRSGHEVFRINYNDGFPRIVFPDELKFAGNRDFYKQSIELRLDEIYMSSMHLLPKRNRASRKALLHLACPITDADGINVGVLVIDFLGGPLLEALGQVTDDSDNEIMLLDQNGRCLKGPSKNSKNEEAASKCRSQGFSRSHPAEWGTISAEDNGQFVTEAGMFTYATVNLSRTIRQATNLQGAHKAPLWKLVAWTHPQSLDEISASLLQKLAFYSGIVLLMAALLTVAQAMQRTRRSAAETHVRRQTAANLRFVPKEFLGLLHKSGLTEVAISDNVERHMTTLFTDIRSYTKLSESMTPKQVLDFLNAYYKVLDPIIEKNGGFIDAYIGDAVMALFPDGAEGAVRSAVEIRIALRDFRPTATDGLPTLVETGFGLHCGEVTIGAVGTDRRMQTTAIGDAVNLAARIESSTKVFGVNVIISDSVRKSLPDTNRFHMRSIDKVRVKGKQEVVELYEIFDPDPPELLRGKLENIKLFESAMRHYREGDFKTAIEEFRLHKQVCPRDLLPDIYIKRCNTMMRIPPGDGWTGVSTL